MKHIRTWSAAFVAAALTIPAAAQNGNAANAVWMDAPLGGAIDGRPAVMPPHARAHGKPLTQWIGDYWRWYYTMAGQTPYYPGDGSMAFMPIPEGEFLGGSWTPEDPGYLQGQLELNLEPGTPFVLPQFSFVAEIGDGFRDPMIPYSEAHKIVTNVSYTLDGVQIVDNFWDWYVEGEFDPPIMYPDPPPGGYIGAWAYQGNGFVWLPLTPGTHEIKLYEELRIFPDQVPGWAPFGIIYDNTWIIHVAHQWSDPKIANLAADWWQWIMDIPAATNPKFDLTGEFVYIGQSTGANDVFFLADTFGSGTTVVRSCEVDYGRPLFFPITDCIWWAPEDGRNPPELRALCRAAMDGATTLECTVDGVPLENVLGIDSLWDLRVQTPPFMISDTLLLDFGFPPGKRLCVGEGYWALLEDLPPGDHVIWLYMEITEGPFTGAWHDVTWNVKIVE